MKKNILKIMLGTIIIEVILICIFILIGDFSEVSWKALGSVGVIFTYSIPCLFYSKIYNNEKYKSIAVSGATIVGVVALGNILFLWKLLPESDILLKMLSTFQVAIWFLAFTSWLLSFSSSNKLSELFKKISISFMLILSFLMVIIIWTDFPEGLLARLFYMLLVLTVGSFIATLILKIIYKNNDNQQSIVENTNIENKKIEFNNLSDNLLNVNNQSDNFNILNSQTIINQEEKSNQSNINNQIR